MSVLSRTPHRTHKVTLPEQRTGSPRTSSPTGAPTGPNRARAAGVLAAGVVVLAAAGTATWAALDDGSPAPSAPAPTVEISQTEAERDAALARRGPADERLQRENQRDANRSSVQTP